MNPHNPVNTVNLGTISGKTEGLLSEFLLYISNKTDFPRLPGIFFTLIYNYS